MMWPAGLDKHQDNPYVSLLSGALASVGVRVAEFRPSMVLSPKNRVRVWHIHWPDSLLRDGHRARRAIRVGVFLALVLLWRLRGRPVVWTIHNIGPHNAAGSRLQKLLYFVVTRSVAVTLTLSDAAAVQSRARWPVLRRVPNASVRHGLYPVRTIDRIEARRQLHDRWSVPLDLPLVVHIGRLDPYKGVERLGPLQRKNLALLIAGAVPSERYRTTLLETFGSHEHTVVVPRFLSDDEIALVYSAADLAVFPYRRILQSGSALLALSHGVPVVVPDTAVFRELAEEAGADWVHVIGDGDAALPSAVEGVRSAGRDHGPRLVSDPRWDWATIARAVDAVYAEVR